MDNKLVEIKRILNTMNLFQKEVHFAIKLVIFMLVVIIVSC